MRCGWENRMNDLLSRFLVSLSLSVLAVGCLFISMAEAEDSSSSSTVKVRLIGQNGLLTEPVAVPKVKKTDAEWRKQLTPEQFEIARGEGTEPAFCGTLLDNHREGIYHCVCCGLPLFSSDSKFNRNRLAKFLPARRQGKRPDQNGRQLWDASHG